MHRRVTDDPERFARTPVARVAGAAAMAVLVIAGSACSSRTSVADDRGDTVAGPSTSRADSVDVIDVSIVAEHPHDPEAFTQGLEFIDADRLVESTGRRGESDVRFVDAVSGRVGPAVALDDDLFGEGVTVGPEGIVQLTWTSGRVFRRDPDTLAVIGEWSIETEGWGVAWDEGRDHYVTSDGTSSLRFRDAVNFDETGRVEVTEGGRPVTGLNELEIVDGALYANVWRENRILRIDPGSGEVTGVIDASPLATLAGLGSGEVDVLNGVAHRPGDPPTRLWITGKDWPTMFVVDLIES